MQNVPEASELALWSLGKAGLESQLCSHNLPLGFPVHCLQKHQLWKQEQFDQHRPLGLPRVSKVEGEHREALHQRIAAPKG